MGSKSVLAPDSVIYSWCFYLLVNKSNCGIRPRQARWQVNNIKMLLRFPVFPKQGNVSQYLSDDIHYNGHNLTKSKHLRGEDKVLSDSIIGSKGVQRQAHTPRETPKQPEEVQASGFKIVTCTLIAVRPLQTNNKPKSFTTHVEGFGTLKYRRSGQKQSERERKKRLRQKQAMPSPAESLTGIHQRWWGPGRKQAFQPLVMDGRPQIRPFFQINLW